MKQLYESRLKGRNGYKGNDQKEKVSSADKAVMFRVFNQLPGARKSDVKGIKDDKVCDIRDTDFLRSRYFFSYEI